MTPASLLDNARRFNLHHHLLSAGEHLNEQLEIIDVVINDHDIGALWMTLHWILPEA